MSQQPQPSTPQPETIIDERYLVVRMLGEGGFGQVFACKHVGTGRPFAVKTLLPEIAKRPGVLPRFLREAKAAGSIKSPNVIDVVDVGQCRTSKAAFIAMELLDGEDLAKTLEQRGKIVPDLAYRIAEQALAGLCAAHAVGVVHRDLKPANLFLTRSSGGARTVKVLDFGIAKVLGDGDLEGAHLTRTGNILGSPWYMSPEQAVGSTAIDHRTDIRSFGAVLYEILSGTPPYHGVTTIHQLIAQICSGPPRPLIEVAPHVPPELSALIAKAMAHAPADRFQTAEEMLGAVKQLHPGGAAITDDMLGLIEAAAPASASPGSPVTAVQGMTQPMPSAPAVTHGGLARSHGGLARSVERSAKRTWVLRALTVLAGAAIGVVVLKLVPRKQANVVDEPDAGFGGAVAAQLDPTLGAVPDDAPPVSDAGTTLDAGATQDDGGAAVMPSATARPAKGRSTPPAATGSSNSKATFGRGI